MRKTRKILPNFLIIASISILLTQIYGLFFPPDFRDRFTPTPAAYENALDLINGAYKDKGRTYDFIEKATKIYAQSIEYTWPKDISNIKFYDNWILYVLGFFDPIFYKLKLTNTPEAFSFFESTNYKRAFKRGFGICSQNAIGMADLLMKKYGIDIYILNLDGHTLTQADINGNNSIHDPSVGISFNFGINQAKKYNNLIMENYSSINRENLGKTLQHKPFLFSKPGACPCRGKLCFIEKISEILKWIIPFFIFVLGIYLRKRKYKSKV